MVSPQDGMLVLLECVDASLYPGLFPQLLHISQQVEINDSFRECESEL